MTSAIRRLLEEISWEGNAAKFHDGGLGKENVLTAEVFQALDYLPRSAFLGQALRAAHGADLARTGAASDAENLVVEVLPGDLVLPDQSIRAQPDALLRSDHSYVFVEAKRIRRSVFEAEQLARELLLTSHHAADRRPLMLLILGAPPPIPVRGHGRLDVTDAVMLGSQLISERLGRQVPLCDPLVTVAHTTWAEIADVVTRAAEGYEISDDSAVRAIQRIANSAVAAVSAHS